jgi:hypothetical protein
MKLAVLSESPADDAAVRILVEGLLGGSTEEVCPKSLRHRSGLSSISRLLPAIVAELHYNTDADALALVVDGNGSPMHEPAHEEDLRGGGSKCRACQFRRRLSQVCQALKPRPHAEPLRFALGVAYPAIEAWYLCGDPVASEAAWRDSLERREHAPAAIRKLKKAVYGVEKPGLEHETACAVQKCKTLVGRQADLQAAFPVGSGALACDVQSW